MDHTDTSHACREYEELSRRQFLSVSGGAAVAAAAVPMWLPRVVFARDACTDRDVIVSMYLRGACDGLTLCVPHAEDAYYNARPRLAIPRPDSGDPNAAIDLDGFFGFPKPMSALLDAYNAGHLAIVHATGSQDPTRSHFEAQRFMETGQPGGSLFTGWLGRHLMTSAPSDPEAVLRGVGISHALQRMLAGAPLTLPVPDLAKFTLGGNAATEPRRRTYLGYMYGRIEDPVKAAAENTLATIDMLGAIDFENYQPAGGAVYPQSDLGYALKSTAALIKAQVGVEAIAIDVGGWDTHNDQQPIEGYMAGLMQGLADSLGAFHLDIFTDTTNVTTVAMSEFGRRVAENGSLGTDHGHGNVMFVIGDNIQGGQVLTNWPGLSAGQLYDDRDLDVTIDYRDIMAEIVTERLKNPNLDTIFPDYTPTIRGITRPCG